MTNDRPWNAAARNARDHRRQVVCGPAGPDRDALAAGYREANKLAGASPESLFGVSNDLLKHVVSF